MWYAWSVLVISTFSVVAGFNSINSLRNNRRRCSRLEAQNDAFLLSTTERRSRRIERLVGERSSSTQRQKQQQQQQQQQQQPPVSNGQLDANQWSCITTTAPALLLQAGPGTGKSHVLSARIAHLLSTKQCMSQEMLILSHTNADAKRLKSNALQMLQQPDIPIWSGTFHSFAKQILVKYGKMHISISTDSEIKARIHKCLVENKGLEIETINYRNLEQTIGYIHRIYGLWKEMGVSQETRPEEASFCAQICNVPTSAIQLAIQLLPSYEEQKSFANQIDPADLPLLAIEFLTYNPKVLHGLRNRLRHVIVDEYQDVSPTQRALLRLMILGTVQKRSMMAKNSIYPSYDSPLFDVPKLFCAGDGDQSIYTWRGAAPLKTMGEFLTDFPQGVVVPLGVSYRLPKHIWNAAHFLLTADSQAPVQQTIQAFETSPAARQSTIQLVIGAGTAPAKLTLNQVMQSLFSDSTTKRQQILVQNLWDAREEAKWVAKSIRKRHKSRLQALHKLDAELWDSSNVAIMVRTNSQIAPFISALEAVGIPIQGGPTTKFSSTIKPVQILTMHRSKGEEFDDVYLAGWEEGVFPHPSSCVHDERRLAYVALTRARQRAVITYASVKVNVGTVQVHPSRFLYELLSDEQSVHWNSRAGIKEHVSGRDLPLQFAKSYEKARNHNNAKTTPSRNKVDVTNMVQHLDKVSYNTHYTNGKQVSKNCALAESGISKMLHLVRQGLEEIEAKRRGACQEYTQKFRYLLKEQFDLSRGRIAVSTDEGTRPLSRCTAAQLGQYLESLLLKTK